MNHSEGYGLSTAASAIATGEQLQPIDKRYNVEDDTTVIKTSSSGYALRNVASRMMVR